MKIEIHHHIEIGIIHKLRVINYLLAIDDLVILRSVMYIIINITIRYVLGWIRWVFIHLKTIITNNNNNRHTTKTILHEIRFVQQSPLLRLL